MSRNRKTIAILILIASIGAVKAQSNLYTVLQQVDSNNLTLKSLRQRLEADRIASRIGLNPGNPQAEVIYQWGSPVDIGNKTTISITQEFSFPTAYIYRAKLAKGVSKSLEHEYRTKRGELLKQAGFIYADLVYHNALIKELQKQQKSAQVISQSLKQKFDAGEIGIIPYTQAELMYRELNARLAQTMLEQKNLSDELVALNGSISIAVSDTLMLTPDLPDSFETWYAQNESLNPELAFFSNEMENSLTRLKLAKAEFLPKFNTGYASEELVGERFQGVVVGVSIPLWEKSNTIRYAKANQKYIQLLADDYFLTYKNSAGRLFKKASALRELLAQLSENINRLDITQKLNLALEKGEISIVDYYTELNNYNSIKERFLQLQLEYIKAYIELNRYSF